MDRGCSSNRNLDSLLSRLRRHRGRVSLWALALALGLLYAFVVVGPRVLNPLDLSWLDADPATGVLGWRFFRQETHLTLPLGWSGRIGYPLGEPIAYFDSIPVLATFGWLIRGILPEDVQYLGLYFAVCCVLQFYFGVRICRRLCGGSAVSGALGGCLFLTAPAFTWRAAGHFALASHWLILAALDQLLGSLGRPSPRQIAWRALLCFLAGGINPYIAFMTLLVLAGAYLRALRHEGNALRRASVGLGAAAGSALVGLALFGFVRIGDISQYAGAGYEKYSMNLLAPIDPGGYGSLLLKQQPIRTGQYEGYNYLGLGLLLTAVVAIARRPSALASLFRRDTVPALGIFVASLFLALSALGEAGNFTLWHVALPHSIMTALAALRCSGRLFWPGYYLLFIGIISAAFKTFPNRLFPPALGFALFIQLLDLSGLQAAIRHQWDSSTEPQVPSDAAWRELGASQKHLVILPPWQCSVPASPGGLNGWAIFGRLALQQHMTINSFYAGRYSDAQTTFFCDQQAQRLEKAGLQDDTAYVFKRNAVAAVIGLQYNDNYCRYVDEYILCSRVAGRSGLDTSVSRDVVTLHSGDIVRFADSEPLANRMIGPGWANPEPWGRWMVGHNALILFKVPPPRRRDLRLELSIRPFVPPSHPLQHVDLVANGEPLLQTTFHREIETSLGLTIPARLIGDDGLVRLKFLLPDAFSPASVGMSDDPRQLSIGVKQLRIEDDGG